MGTTLSTEIPVVLETPRGNLKGLSKCDKESGKPIYNRYTRVPFALPPVDGLRWKRPVQLPEDFSFSTASGDPGDYTKFGPVCPQPVYSHGAVELRNNDAAPEPEITYSEDCLYLNIWVPSGEAPPGGWPVQFYIHGGWLQMGDANCGNKQDPYYLLQDFPRIIVAPTYRLNLFGFMTCSELDQEQVNIAPGNYGFWDQRLALEWTHKYIPLFNGNANNISVGGLSAGAYSTIFQLAYDIRRSNPAERIIKRIYLFSNAVGVQPKSVYSSESQTQFKELLSVLDIPLSLSAANKLAALRKVSSTVLAESISKLKLHTFRAGTDDDFISAKFLSDISDGTMSSILADRGAKVMLGEVADEKTLYRLVNPASSYDSLVLELNNYYPAKVTQSLLKTYPLPKEGASKDEWADVGAQIIGDCQVHAPIRGFAASLLSKMPLDSVYRYRISWRPESLDKWLDPAVGMCHASDIPIWWACGARLGYTDSDIALVKEWLRDFYKFLNNESLNWGVNNLEQVREMTKVGQIKVVKDVLWEDGLKTWDTMVRAQLE